MLDSHEGHFDMRICLDIYFEAVLGSYSYCADTYA
jgi:hypothetical protein